MSNRLLGLLIILGCILIWIAFYLYAFIKYTGSIVIYSNQKEYSVLLENKKKLVSIKKECAQKKCVLEKVSPFDYNIIIKKEWYHDISDTIWVERKKMKTLNVEMEKDVRLEEVSKIDEIKTRTIEKKKKKIQDKKKYHLFVDIDNNKRVLFEKEESAMGVYLENSSWKKRHIASFSEILHSSKIQVQGVYWDSKKVFIQYWDEKLLFNGITGNLENINLNFSIKYIKTGVNRSLIFVTDKGSFIYKNKKFEYFPMFEDFVYRDWNYIGFLWKNDHTRKKNLNLEGDKWNILVLFSPKTKEKRVVYRLKFKLQKIIIRDNNLLLEGDEWKEFILKNY